MVGRGSVREPTTQNEWSFFMPRVTQAHLDARRQQIVDAARERFGEHGFARTSMPDLAEASGLSIGAIYRYFTGKDEIITAICEQASDTLPTELTAPAVREFLEQMRVRAATTDHARLVAQIYAEAAVSPPLADLVRRQLSALRAAVAELLPEPSSPGAAAVAEAFTALCLGYSHQLALRGDLDPEPFVTALMAVVAPASAPPAGG
jgi:TetR/AcrR family transcriptional regulator, transcriptional repressor of aconitase